MKLERYVVMIVGVDSGAAVPKGARDLGVAGIRAARAALGDRLGSTEQRASETWEEAIEALSNGAEFPIGSSDSPETAQEAAGAAQTASEGVLGVEVQINEAEPQKPGESLDSIEFETRLYKVHTDAETGTQVAHPGEGIETREAVLLDDIAEALGDRSPFSWGAIAYAITAMATASGNPSMALSIVRSFGRHGEPELWEEAAAVLEAAFSDG